jgi:hypothetical protein
LWQKADHHLLLQQKDRVRMVTSSRLLEHQRKHSFAAHRGAGTGGLVLCKDNFF